MKTSGFVQVSQAGAIRKRHMQQLIDTTGFDKWHIDRLVDKTIVARKWLWQATCSTGMQQPVAFGRDKWQKA